MLAAALASVVLASAAQPIEAPTWSPDGTRIAWAQEDGTTHDIWSANADGTKPHLLAPGVPALFQLAWLPDRTFLYVTNYRIFRVGASGVPRQIAFGSAVTVDRRGKRIAFQTAEACKSCKGPIEVAPLAGGHARQIGGLARNIFPALSPDGRTVAFSHDGGVYLSAASGGRLTRLSAAGNCPQWAPDGKRLVYANDKGLHVVDRDGGNDRVLLHGVGIPTCGYAWAPRGSQVAAVNPRGHLFMIDAATGTSRTIGPRHTVDIAWAPDATRLLLTGGTTAKACSSLWLMKPDGSGLRTLHGC